MSTARDRAHGARRRLARAETRLGNGFAELVDRTPDRTVDSVMRGPASRLVVAAIFQQMPRRVDRSRAAGLDAVVRWNVEVGAGGRIDTYDLVLRDGRARVVRPHAQADEEPRLTITLTAAELVRIAAGRSDAMQAYFKRRLKLGGDIMLAAKLASLFRIPRARALPPAA